MFGLITRDKLVQTEARLKLAEDRLADAQNLLNRMEVELHYWRERADDERVRADRIADAERVDRGQSEVSEPVLRVKRKDQAKFEAEVEKQQKELAEMFSDSFDGEDELNWVEPELREAASKWMETAKQERAERKTEKAPVSGE